MTLQDRLKNLRFEKDFTLEEVSLRLGVAKQTLFKYENAIISNIPLNKLEALGKIYDVDPAFLTGWNENCKSIKAIRVPVLSRIPSGVPIDTIEDILDWEELDPHQLDPHNDYFGLLVHGDSMYPEYLDGDIIIVQQTDDADSGKDVVAYVNGCEATLKRLYRYENGSIELRPINHNYETRIFSIDEIKTEPVIIIGIVKELRRKK